MFCKNCKSELKNGQKFCSYCGTKVDNDKENENTYNDPFKDYRIENNSHQDQYNYQQKYSNDNLYKDKNQNQIKYKEPESYKQNNQSLISCIFMIAGFISLFFQPLLSILFGILALIFGITGRKHTSKIFGTVVLVFSVLSFIGNMILGPIVFVGNLEFTMAGEKTTIFNYFIAAFQTGFNEHKLYDTFYSKEGYMFVLDDYYGRYYLYSNEENQKTKYFTGSFTLEDGVTKKNQETLYEDSNYYYYTLITSNQYFVDETGKKINDTLLFNTDFIIKLNKKDKTKIVLLNEFAKFNYEFIKSSKKTSNTLPTT